MPGTSPPPSEPSSPSLVRLAHRKERRILFKKTAEAQRRIEERERAAAAAVERRPVDEYKPRAKKDVERSK